MKRHVFVALAVAGAVFYLVYVKSEKNTQILEIRDSGSGRIYERWSVEESSEFSIEFIHSVNQSPVRETFVIEKGMNRLKDLRFYSFGAGIPSYLEEGWVLGRDGDAMVISGFTTAMKELNYIVGTVSDHLLFIDGVEVSLRDLCGINAHITIRLR